MECAHARMRCAQVRMRQPISLNTSTTTIPATYTFDLHPLYVSILREGDTIRKGEVLGLDGDLRRVLVAPITGTIRLLVLGTGAERRVKVFLSEPSRPAPASTARR